MGRISGRPWGFPVAAYGENLMATHNGVLPHAIAVALIRPIVTLAARPLRKRGDGLAALAMLAKQACH